MAPNIMLKEFLANVELGPASSVFKTSIILHSMTKTCSYGKMQTHFMTCLDSPEGRTGLGYRYLARSFKTLLESLGTFILLVFFFVLFVFLCFICFDYILPGPKTQTGNKMNLSGDPLLEGLALVPKSRLSIKANQYRDAHRGKNESMTL